MKPYKSIFAEAKSISSKSEAKQVVDISNLSLSGVRGGEMTWEEAMSKQKNGWRLPTIQELWTICLKFNKDELDFEDSNKIISNETYWSSSESGLDSYMAWSVSFYNSMPSCDEYRKKSECYVLLVKEI